jgi:hypothetical protein
VAAIAGQKHDAEGILAELFVQVDKGWRRKVALLDGGALVNCLSERLAKAWNLKGVEHPPVKAEAFDTSPVQSVGAYKATVKLRDGAGREHVTTQVFYAFPKVARDVIIGLPWLMEANPNIDWHTLTWRYQIKRDKIVIDSPEGFLDSTKNVPVFALVCSSLGPGSTPVVRRIPEPIQSFEDCFDPKRAEMLPEHGDADHAIELLPGTEPPYGPLYALSEKELHVLRDYLLENLASGRVRESISQAGAPVLFVPKRDGSLRLCVDYRGLNAITMKNRCPLPLIEETLDRLVGAAYFTKLNLKDAYRRVRIRKGDEWKTAFRTRYGHFEYAVIPFGLANAPATFQTLINKALRGLVDHICVVYLDDILIYSKTREEHWDFVKQVLERLRQFKLYAKLSKCCFMTTSVEFLGYIISDHGISMDPSRVDSIRTWPEPKTLRELQVFHGFANFYRRFVKYYAKITRALTELLKGSKQGKQNGPFIFDETAQAAFVKLIEAFTTAPMLVHFDPQKPIRVETDASGFAIAAILTQLVTLMGAASQAQWHPVAFYSRKMIPAETRYETHDQELLSIVAAFQNWRHYLEGSHHPISVLTDHNNLRYFMTTTTLNRRQSRWALVLAEYDFEIKYRPGKTNPADGPSRRPDYEGEADDEICLPTLQNKLKNITIAAVGLTPVITRGAAKEQEVRPDGALDGPQVEEIDEDELDGFPDSRSDDLLQGAVTQTLRRTDAEAACTQEQHLESPSSLLRSKLEELQSQDPVVTRVKSQLSSESERDACAERGWRVDGRLLYYFHAVYVPNEAAIRAELLHLHHDDPLAGHFGVKKTRALMIRKFYWPKMAKDIEQYVQGCDVCQRTKAPRHRPYGELAALSVPTRPWAEITMDFITNSLPVVTAMMLMMPFS